MTSSVLWIIREIALAAMAAEAAECVSSLICTSVVLSSPTLDLSSKCLTELPEELYTARHVECLYLEGNKLAAIPHELFENLPNLRWLDLRNNKISQLPSSIGSLRHLKALLVEGNCLASLPPELGKLTSLTGLHLTGNPLQSPPQSVVERGTQAVLQYLRSLLSNCHVCSETPPPRFTFPSKQMPRTSIPFAVALKPITPISKLPPVLPTVPEAPSLPAPTPHKVHLFPIEHQPQKRAESKETHHIPKFKPTRKVGRRLPVLENTGHRQAPAIADTTTSRAEEGKVMQKTSHVKTLIAKEEQNFKDKRVLKDWRDKRKKEQRQNVAQAARMKFSLPPVTAPFATEVNSNKEPKDEALSSQESTSSVSSQSKEARQRELAEKIRQHTTRIQQQLRFQTMKGTAQRAAEEITEDIRKAEDYLEKVMEKKREYRFTAFTAEPPLIKKRT